MHGAIYSSYIKISSTLQLAHIKIDVHLKCFWRLTHWLSILYIAGPSNWFNFRFSLKLVKYLDLLKSAANQMTKHTIWDSEPDPY